MAVATGAVPLTRGWWARGPLGAAAQAFRTKVYAADRKVYMYEVRMREQYVKP
jgi:hypothetical protein